MRHVEWIALHRISDVLACDTDLKLTFLCPGRERGSILEVRNAERPRTCLPSINIFNIIASIGVLKEKLHYFDIALVRLRAVARQEVGRDVILDIVHHQGRKK